VRACGSSELAGVVVVSAEGCSRVERRARARERGWERGESRETCEVDVGREDGPGAAARAYECPQDAGGDGDERRRRAGRGRSTAVDDAAPTMGAALGMQPKPRTAAAPRRRHRERAREAAQRRHADGARAELRPTALSARGGAPSAAADEMCAHVPRPPGLPCGRSASPVGHPHTAAVPRRRCAHA
jgi:hypothetical protein